MNKTDLVDAAQLAALKALLMKLNPSAKLVATQHGRVSAAEVLNTSRFDEAAAQTMPGWLQVRPLAQLWQ